MTSSSGEQLLQWIRSLNGHFCKEAYSFGDLKNGQVLGEIVGEVYTAYSIIHQMHSHSSDDKESCLQALQMVLNEIQQQSTNQGIAFPSHLTALTPMKLYNESDSMEKLCQWLFLQKKLLSLKKNKNPAVRVLFPQHYETESSLLEQPPKQEQDEQENEDRAVRQNQRNYDQQNDEQSQTHSSSPSPSHKSEISEPELYYAADLNPLTEEEQQQNNENDILNQDSSAHNETIKSVVLEKSYQVIRPSSPFHICQSTLQKNRPHQTSFLSDCPLGDDSMDAHNDIRQFRQLNQKREDSTITNDQCLKLSGFLNDSKTASESSNKKADKSYAVTDNFKRGKSHAEDQSKKSVVCSNADNESSSLCESKGGASNQVESCDDETRIKQMIPRQSQISQQRTQEKRNDSSRLTQKPPVPLTASVKGVNRQTANGFNQNPQQMKQKNDDEDANSLQLSQGQRRRESSQEQIKRDILDLDQQIQDERSSIDYRQQSSRQQQPNLIGLNHPSMRRTYKPEDIQLEMITDSSRSSVRQSNKITTCQSKSNSFSEMSSNRSQISIESTKQHTSTRIKKSIVKEEEKHMLLEWLYSICLIKKGIPGIVSKLPKVCRNGLLFADIINRMTGKSEDALIGLIRQPKNDSEIKINYTKLFSYLRNQPRINSRYLFHTEQNLLDSDEDVFWGLLYDLWMLYHNKQPQIPSLVAAIEKKRSITVNAGYNNEFKGSTTNGNQVSERNSSRGQYADIEASNNYQNQHDKNNNELELNTQGISRSESNCSSQKLEAHGYKELHLSQRNGSSKSTCQYGTPRKMTRNQSNGSLSRRRLITVDSFKSEDQIASSLNKNTLKMSFSAVKKKVCLTLEMEMETNNFLGRLGLSAYLVRKGSDLCRDPLRNGSLLCQLLEKLDHLYPVSRYSLQPVNVLQCKENVVIALDYLKKLADNVDIPLYLLNNTHEDILAGSHDVIWTLLYFVMKAEHQIRKAASSSKNLSIEGNQSLKKCLDLGNSFQETILLPYSSEQLRNLCDSLVSWVNLILQTSRNDNSFQSNFQEIVSACQDGMILCEIVSTILNRTIKPSHSHPVSDQMRLANIQKALNPLKQLSECGQKFVWKELLILQGNSSAIVGLLEDLRRFNEGLAPRKGDNYFEEGPYLGGNRSYLDAGRRLPLTEQAVFNEKNNNNRIFQGISTQFNKGSEKNMNLSSVQNVGQSLNINYRNLKSENGIKPQRDSHRVEREASRERSSSVQNKENRSPQSLHLIKWLADIGFVEESSKLDLSEAFINMFKDGTLICKIIEHLEGQTIPGKISHPNSQQSCLTNIRKAFFVLKKKLNFNAKLLADEQRMFQAKQDYIVSFLSEMRICYKKQTIKNTQFKKSDTRCNSTASFLL